MLPRTRDFDNIYYKMELLTAVYPVIVIAVAVLSRLPFMKFPIDEDFACYVYRPSFARQGIRWKDDVIIHCPMIKMIASDAIYGTDPQKGVFRIRVFFTVMHSVTSLIVYVIVNTITGNPSAALLSGVLYAFFGSAHALSVYSFNFEQVYWPLVLSGAFLLWMGEGWTAHAGFLFGFAVIPKFTTGIYIPFMALGVWYGYGFWHMVIFTCAAAAPFVAALSADFFLGYLDSKARRQFRTRLAVALRLPSTKELFGSRVGDLKMIIGQTLPLWVLGVPALVVSIMAGATGAASGVMGGGFWAILFTAVTLSMIPFQKAFSRYHYIPLVCILAIGTGVGADWLAMKGGTFAIVAGLLFTASAAYSIFRLYPFYVRPLSNETLAKHDKYDQYIYVPRVGRLLGRLARMRGEKGRIFVWGSFSQIYIYSRMLSADAFIHFAVGPWDEEAMAGYFDTVIGGLVKHRPVYLVKDFSNLDIEYLEEITGLKYKLLKVVLARFPIYRLESSVPPDSDPLSLPWREKMRIFEKLTRGKPLAGIDISDFKQGRYKVGVREYRKLMRINPKDAEGFSFIKAMYEHIRFDASALRIFEKILMRFPAPRYARLILSRQRMEEGKTGEAGELIEEERGLFGDGVEVYYYMGMLGRYEGRHDDAVVCFEKAFKCNARNVEMLLCMGESYMASGNVIKGTMALKRAWEMASHPQDMWVRTRAALALSANSSGRETQSEELKRYIEKDPENETLKYAFAGLCEKEGGSDTASKIYTEIADGAKETLLRGNAYYHLARLLPENAPEGKRGEMLKKCIELNPYHGAAKKLFEERGEIHAKT